MRSDLNSSVRIPVGEASLLGDLIIPKDALGVVLFAHGSGSSRSSPRNRSVARIIRDAGLGTLLFDLLTSEEEQVDIYTRHLRFDIGLLAERLRAATEWLAGHPEMTDIRFGYFGASTGAAAALVAAADLPDKIAAVVSRGGRPDLAGDALSRVTAPTLLIIGEYDETVIELNREAMRKMDCQTELKIVPRATHLFEEQGALDLVASLATDWFLHHLSPHAIATAA